MNIIIQITSTPYSPRGVRRKGMNNEVQQEGAMSKHTLWCYFYFFKENRRQLVVYLHLHNLMKWSMNKFLLNKPYCMLFVEKYVQAIRWDSQHSQSSDLKHCYSDYRNSSAPFLHDYNWHPHNHHWTSYCTPMTSALARVLGQNTPALTKRGLQQPSNLQ